MKTNYNENEKVRVKSEVKIIRGMNVIKITPEDVLVVIGMHKGEVCARFDDCANTPNLHDAFFGRFYLLPSEVVPAN